MAFRTEAFTMGVEEEYQLIDPATRELSSSAHTLLTEIKQEHGEKFQSELNLSQIEAVSPVCSTLAEVKQELTYMRREVSQFAMQGGTRIGAAGTHPFSHWKDQHITPKERYQNIAADYQQLALEPIFGYHIHVGLEDQEVALQIMNRSRSWLNVLLALSSNSPFWLGHATGYASYRTLLWSQWATSGPPQTFASLQEYQELTQAMINIGAIEDPTKLYWDIRLSARFNTIEFRIADVCLTVDEATMLAGLIRGLVHTCYEQVMRKEAQPTIRHEVVRAAHWHAARYGLSHELIDVMAQRSMPARTLVEQFLSFTRPALEAIGDWEEVSTLVQQMLQGGSGAERQLAVYQRTKRIEEVVDFIIDETLKGIA